MKKVFRKIPSLDYRYEVSRDGVVRNIKSKKIKKQFITRFGYYRTSYRVNKTNPHYNPSQGWDRPLHQLVMEVWGPEQPSPNHIIDHIDRNKLNNNIENLRWVTPSENKLNCDMELFKLNNSLGQLNSKRKKRIAIELEDVKTGEKIWFNSRFRAAEWLIANKKTTTKNACAMARRLSLCKYTSGYKVRNIMPND